MRNIRLFGYLLLLLTTILVSCDNPSHTKADYRQQNIPNAPLPSGPQPSREELVDFLKNNQRSPEAYILDKFKTHDVVLLSEDHAVKHNLELCKSIIPQLYAAGVYNFGMEFGAEEDQAQLDSLVNAPEFSDSLARRLMFNYNVGWVFNEYMDIYREAWKLNRSLPAGARKFRVLNISYRFKWERCDERFFGIRTPALIDQIFDRGNTEYFRANLIRREVLDKKEKILVLAGFGHSYTRYVSPYYDYRDQHFVKFDNERMGNILYKHAPDKVFSILLHYPFDGRTYGYAQQFAPASGWIDQALAGFVDKRIGFDLVGTAAGFLRDTSQYSYGYADFKLQDMADGYIYQMPFEQYEGCSIDSVFLTDENWPEVVKYYPDKDVSRVPANKEEYLRNIGFYVDMKLRYRNLQPIPLP